MEVHLPAIGFCTKKGESTSAVSSTVPRVLSGWSSERSLLLALKSLAITHLVSHYPMISSARVRISCIQLSGIDGGRYTKINETPLVSITTACPSSAVLASREE